MSIDKEELDKIGEFKPTTELQWRQVNINMDSEHTGRKMVGRPILQQKWANELGEEEWRDIPLVISE